MAAVKLAACRVRQWLDESKEIQEECQFRGLLVIGALVERHGLRGLGRRLNIAAPNLCAMRNGRRTITPEMFLKLCDEFEKLKARPQ